MDEWPNVFERNSSNSVIIEKYLKRDRWDQPEQQLSVKYFSIYIFVIEIFSNVLNHVCSQDAKGLMYVSRVALFLRYSDSRCIFQGNELSVFVDVVVYFTRFSSCFSGEQVIGICWCSCLFLQSLFAFFRETSCHTLSAFFHDVVVCFTRFLLHFSGEQVIGDPAPSTWRPGLAYDVQ